MENFNKPFRLSLLLLLFCIPSLVFAQKRITGTIVNSTDRSPISATVSIKGTTAATTTDKNGHFSLDVRNGQTLVITSVGFELLEVPVPGGTSINLSLTESTTVLTDIVVVGYGTQKKENLTGAVASVSGAKLEARPITNLGSGLQGLIPNLNINRGNGAPGGTTTFNVRGTTSFSGNQPLILVDGVVTDPDIINPQDVESITVLKDAASAAIYGSRGAYGVVLITTKSPKKNAPLRINYSGSYATTRPTRLPDYMNSLDYITIHRQTDRNSNGSAAEKYTSLDSTMTAAYFNDPANNPYVYVDPTQPSGTSKYRYVGNTDWIDVLYPNWAPEMQHSLSISGGGKTSFVASMGAFGQDGLLKIGNETFHRYNANLKVNSEATKWMDLNFKISLNRTNLDKPTPPSHGGLSSGWIPNDLRPTMPVYHPDGHFSGQQNYSNMVAVATLNGRTKNQVNDLFLTGGVVIRPMKNVRLVGDYTWESRSGFNQIHFKEYKEYGVNGIALGFYPWSTPSKLSEATSTRYYYALNGYAEYENTFAGKHYFKAMIGYNEELNRDKDYSVTVKNLIDQEKPAINLNNDPAPIVTGSQSEWAISGEFFRLNYIYNKKYLLEVNGRYAGTSRFIRGNRYLFQPSVSAGWRISDEHFFQPLTKVVDDLKLRASYGTLGNQNTSNYGYIPTMSSGPISYILGSTLAVGVNPAGLISTDFTWETVTSKDIGIDMSLFRKRLAVSFDLYSRKTSGILSAGQALPVVLGTTAPQMNSGALETKGWELSLNWQDKINKNMGYDVILSLSDYSATIKRYDPNPNKTLNTLYVGQKVGEIWGYTTEGFFQTDAEAAATNQTGAGQSQTYAGDIKFVDLNKDGKIDAGAGTIANPGDRSVIGNQTPHYQFGISLGFNYKGFDFSAFFQGVAKMDYMLSGSYFWPFATDEYDVPLKYQLDYWTPTNTNAYYPRPRFGGGGNYQAQTKYLQNAAYIRMKNISLGYSLPISFIKKARFQKARLYASAENVFVITKMHKAFDPELLGATAYPLNKAVSFGLQLGF